MDRTIITVAVIMIRRFKNDTDSNICQGHGGIIQKIYYMCTKLDTIADIQSRK